MSDRGPVLQQLSEAAAGANWHALPDALFQLLYELPATLQVEIGSFPMHRYLPIFEQHWPGVGWPRRLLADVAAWVAQHGRALPDEPADTGPADAAFLLGCDALVLAMSQQKDSGVLTSSCVYSTERGIDARFVAVWERDDPEAVRIWRGQVEPAGHGAVSLLEGRTALDNKAAQQVRRAEWLALIEFLNEHAVGAAPGVADVAAMMRDLRRWSDRERCLIPDE